MMQQIGMYLFPPNKSGNAVAAGQNLPMGLLHPSFA
jgi:hypothetical protein